MLLTAIPLWDDLLLVLNNNNNKNIKKLADMKLGLIVLLIFAGAGAAENRTAPQLW